MLRIVLGIRRHLEFVIKDLLLSEVLGLQGMVRRVLFVFMLPMSSQKEWFSLTLSLLLSTLGGA